MIQQAYTRLLLAFALVAMPFGNVWAQQALGWTFNHSQVTRSAQSQTLQVHLQMLPTVQLKRQQVAELTLYYVSADGKQRQQLGTVAVAGATRYKIIERRRYFRNLRPTDPAQGTLYHFEEITPNSPLQFDYTLPYASWMANGNVELREKVYGCAECGETDTTAPTAVRANFFGPQFYTFAYQLPQKAEQKQFSEVLDCYVRFVIDRDEIRREFEGNDARLQELQDFVARHQATLGANLKSADIKGYACPLASATHNADLTARRAKSLANYVKEHHPALAQVKAFTVSGEGEDWAGLRQAVSQSNLPNRDEVVRIIDTYNTDTEREAAIQALDGGATYQQLEAEYFPPLRKSVLTLTFNSRAYTDAELAKVYATQPKALSAEELARLAQAEVNQKRSPLPIYKTAYQMYAPNEAVVLNYATALLQYGGVAEADEALKVLAGVKNTPQVQYLQAIAYDKKGDWSRAEVLLQQSAQGGYEPAKAYTQR